MLINAKSLILCDVNFILPILYNNIHINICKFNIRVHSTYDI